MFTPIELESIKSYCEAIEGGRLDGYTTHGLASQQMRNAREVVEQLFTVGSVSVSAQKYTTDDVLCDMLEGDTWLLSGDSNVTVSTVNLLLMHGYPDEAVRLNNALFTECAIAAVWEDCE